MVLKLYKNFRTLWLGQVVSVIGDGMQRIALLWWARQVGGNGLLTAVALSAMVPVIIVSPFGGWLADRYDRRLLMLVADLSRMTTTAALALLVLTDGQAAPAVCALVALSAVGTAIFDPSYASAVPTLIEPEHRVAANGLNMANSAVGGLIGPLLGGLLIAVTSIGTVLVINAATFLWSAVFVALARVPKPAGATKEAREEHTTAGAISTVVRDPVVRRLLVLASALNMVAAPVPLLIVALAIDRFHVGSGKFGLLEIMVSAGILIGALGASKLARGSISTPMFVLAACLALAGVLPFAGSAAVFVIGGVAIAVANTLLITTFQSVVQPEVQGRVFGVVGALGEGLRPAGLALGAPLLAAFGVSGAFAIVGCCVFLATMVWGMRGFSVSGSGSHAEVATGEVAGADLVAPSA